jgi:hypothetical protein
VEIEKAQLVDGDFFHAVITRESSSAVMR